MKKYILDKNDRQHYAGTTLYRVIYNDGVKGGFIESENNLSHGDNSRVLDSAFVYGSAYVFDNAQVARFAVIGNGEIYGNAIVSGTTRIREPVGICGNAKVEKTRDCIFFSGLGYNVTVTPQNAVIASMVKTHDEWLNITRDKAKSMGIDPIDYKAIRGIFKVLFQKFKDENPSSEIQF